MAANWRNFDHAALAAWLEPPAGDVASGLPEKEEP
jgi:hypothetical protein